MLDQARSHLRTSLAGRLAPIGVGKLSRENTSDNLKHILSGHS